LKDLNKILSFMLKDKKNNSDKISLVLLKKIGSPLINKDYNRKIVANFLKTELSD
jgi:3-dehydroquinate synthase/shikimate kinase/3-dehydroquinate synthase